MAWGSGNAATPASEVYSNPNLLDNWYFANPINQKGQTEYTGGGYGIDRWQQNAGDNSSITLQDDCLLLTGSGEGNYITLWQFLEFPQKLAGEIVTLSFMYKLPTEGESYIFFNGQTEGSTLEQGIKRIIVPTGEKWDVISSTITVPADITKLNVNINAKTSVYVKAAKLELGDRQTLARQDENGNWVLIDPPPDYGTELAKCQRYMIPIYNNSRFPGVTFLSNESGGAFEIATPVQMRALPSIIIQDAYMGVILHDGKTVPVTSHSIQSVSATGIGINAITSGGCTMKQAATLFDIKGFLDANL